MRHRIHYRKLNRTSEHRVALRRNLAQSLVEHGSVTTTVAKAKDLRPFVEKLITMAVHTRKLAAGNDAAGLVIFSGGTDGEDGPTDAAGAWWDAGVCERAAELELDPSDFLARKDAYHFFEATSGMIKTGPTHTNVCDVRVVLVGRVEDE